MQSKSIYSLDFSPANNDPSHLTCVYAKVLEEISTDVSNSTRISQDTKVKDPNTKDHSCSVHNNCILSIIQHASFIVFYLLVSGLTY